MRRLEVGAQAGEGQPAPRGLGLQRAQRRRVAVDRERARAELGGGERVATAAAGEVEHGAAPRRLREPSALREEPGGRRAKRRAPLAAAGARLRSGRCADHRGESRRKVRHDAVHAEREQRAHLAPARRSSRRARRGRGRGRARRTRASPGVGRRTPAAPAAPSGPGRAAGARSRSAGSRPPRARRRRARPARRAARPRARSSAISASSPAVSRLRARAPGLLDHARGSARPGPAGPP